MKKLSAAQIDFLFFAYQAPGRNWDGVFPRSGQRAMVRRLVRRGLLRSVGIGRDVDGLADRRVELYALTAKGARAIRAKLCGGSRGVAS